MHFSFLFYRGVFEDGAHCQTVLRRSDRQEQRLRRLCGVSGASRQPLSPATAESRCGGELVLLNPGNLTDDVVRSVALTMGELMFATLEINELQVGATE